MKRSEKDFPLGDSEAYGYLKKMWERGWLDEYSEKHFLIRLLKGDDELIRSTFNHEKYTFDDMFSYNAETFLINFNFRIQQMSAFFGEKEIIGFIRNQLSAGKKHYNQNMFFQAISEIEIIRYFLAFGNSFEKKCLYEPTVSGSKCNPEARIEYEDGTVVNIEVKTPEFTDKVSRYDRYMPLILLNDTGREKFEVACRQIGAHAIMPRVMKLKQFLNSAGTKFEEIEESENVYNILFINWSYTEIVLNGYYEACSLLYNDINGILKYPEIGYKLGIDEDVYKKVSAVFIYQCPDEMIIFGDMRYLFASRSAAFLINPYIIDTDEKKRRLYHLMRFRENDFKWDESVVINFDVEQGHFSENIVDKLGKIVEENALL